MNSIDQLHLLGQSLWYDNIQRSLLDSGEMKKMINAGNFLGVTSNPSIFHNSISKTKDYDFALKPLSWAGLGAEEIFWELAIKDIQDAADLFTPLYEKSEHKDGYVSLEVSPYLAKDTQGTIDEAKRLWIKVNRPNLMIKIPATIEGIPAIRQTIAEGINVNVTLIFSLERYDAVMDAFLSGLEDRLKTGEKIDNIHSVASFFISRVDTKVDSLITKLVQEKNVSENVGKALLGKAAIANAKLAYQLFKKKFSSDRYSQLKKMGAKKQRPLWASTSTKNPNYRDVIYIEELIGGETVNTVPPATLIAFADHGSAALTVESELDESRKAIEALEKIGISMKKVTDELEQEGVKAFMDAFSALLQSVEERRIKQAEGIGALGHLVRERLHSLEKSNFVDRMLNHDPTLWTADRKGQDEISVRMNWIEAPWESEKLIDELKQLLPDCRKAGFSHALLLGMGGSSLAPEVLRLINGLQGLDLSILDSTNPDEVLAAQKRIPLDKTLFIVASKSGTTGEINAFYQYFWKLAQSEFGVEAGKHFIAITDPDTKLAKLAKENDFWKIFIADPKVGGRNSALTAFGLVPAALVGFDIASFLRKAQLAAESCRISNVISSNPGVVLGVLLAEAAKNGKEKLTLITDSTWTAFGNWMEQLIAESSGKEGKGIVPVANEPPLPPIKYGNDRFFVYLRLTGEHDHFCNQLVKAGHPVITLDVTTAEDLAGQFYLWEFATAVACAELGVNSFDQPDVQDAKTRTLAGIENYKIKGSLDQGKPLLELADGKVFSNQEIDCSTTKNIRSAIDCYLKKMIKDGDYIAINAFVPRNSRLEKDLQLLRANLLATFGCAVTLGFGPRFLHSTGQLHKGGANNGVFIEITADPECDVDIPGEGISFGTMSMAQALGDYQALVAKQRRIIRIHLPKPDLSALLK